LKLGEEAQVFGSICYIYMFLIKGGTSLETRLYEEYSWDIAHNQKAIEFTTYKQKSSSLVEMLK